MYWGTGPKEEVFFFGEAFTLKSLEMPYIHKGRAFWDRVAENRKLINFVFFELFDSEWMARGIHRNAWGIQDRRSFTAWDEYSTNLPLIETKQKKHIDMFLISKYFDLSNF